MAELDSLEIRIQSESQSAASGLDKLTTALTRMKSAAKGGSGLTTLANGLTKLNTALSQLNVNKKALGDLKSGLNGLTNIKTNLTTTANQITKINDAISSLNVDEAKLQHLATALNSLGSVQKAAGLSSTITTLGKIPKITQELKAMDMDEFARQIQRAADALAPLATAMEKVSRGFAAFPSRIQKLIKANEKLSSSSKKAASSLSQLASPITVLATKLASYSYILGRVVDVLATCVTSINEYVENVNLFQVSMGEFYDEAFAYAQLVSDKLGVDPSQWMRTQGVFMSMARGFGVTADQAYALSEGLTELSYDLSSLYNEDIESSALRLQSALAGEIEPIRRLGISISEATLKEYALSLGIDESVESMTEQEKALLRTMKLMEGASNLGAIGDFARTLESPANALRVLKQQIVQLGRSIGSVLLPIIVQILPYVQAFVELLTDAISALASLVGFEMPTWDASDWGSGISAGATEAEDAIDGTTEAAEKLKDATLGLDELNIISPNSGSSGAGGAGGGLGSDWAAGLEIPDIWDKFDLSQITSKADKIKQVIEDNIGEILTVIAGAQLVIGAILALTGVNIPVGLALMASGAATLGAVIAVNWGGLTSELAGVLATMLGMISGFALVIGAVLAFSGVNIPLGIGLMVAGAVGLAAAVAVTWKGMENKIAGVLSIIAGIVGGALIALGAVLAFSGANLPLGIGLMAAGAVSIAAVVAVNWSSMDPNISGAVSRITAIMSGAALAVGAVLAFSGVNIPLGIGLMAAGAATLAAVTALNWNNMDAQLRSIITTITGLLGGALLVIGAIFTFSGTNLPLGIGLMLAGAVSLGTAVALNWDAVLTKVTTALKDVGIAVGASLLAIGAILTLSGVALPLGIGLLAAGGVSLASGVALNWDSIVTSVKTTLGNIGKAFGDFVSEWLSIEKWQQLGQQAIDGLFKGLSNIWSNVQSWGEGLLNDVKDVLGIHSPSVEFESLGEYSVAGLANGFDHLDIVTEKFKAELATMQEHADLFAEATQLLVDAGLDKFTAAMDFMQAKTTSTLADMTERYQDMARQSNLAIQSIIDQLNAIPRNITTVHTIITESVSGGSSKSTTKAYASGGFPDQGQLFIANEAGPELVGTIGGQTAVANAQQIVQGVASGVAEANAQQNALLREQNELLRAILAKEGATYLDGKRLYRAVENASRNTGVMIMSGGMV
ncbi:hypothetical protein B5G43_02895 [Flavonifractor sp. An92]|uniref:hypothetical protein n=1 Tax=Flavonifractor sp. An92 TaxID=1965666 RepID=UPI000B3AC0A1|nr:hypothetical protein [Flavonifractor sp. An92]OUN08343.1 hypothetical protein B5G43_02895 [Flavonifractor sp. An92]